MPKKRSRRTKQKNTRLFSYALLLINVVCWGALLPIIKPSLNVTTPFRYLFYRFVLASILVIPVLIYYWPKVKNKAKNILMICGIELIGTTLTLSLLYFGLRVTSALEASILVTTFPIFITIAGICCLKEKEERHEWIGLGIAFLCTVLLTAIPLLKSSHLPSSVSLIGNILIIGQNIFNAIYFILGKKYYHNLPKLFVTSISFYLGAVSFFLLSLTEVHFSTQALWQAAQIDSQSPLVWLAVIYAAIFGSIIGLTTMIKGQDGIEVSEAGLFGYLQPLVFIPLSVWWLRESFTWTQFLLLLGVIFGVYISERRFKTH